ncbi:hypothetical protein CCR75_003720 [Bremia lactucae]|uniref:MIR domain-containing protein n=1 Tax=Bremia lactucae TaxID=4779 RepID=A0A976IJL9_BRELC|nr:hypothetical protein CCR75_003720 [Bremia lactucae]
MRWLPFLSVLISALPSDATASHCVKWRATSHCDAHGVREPNSDAACSKRIASGRSGFCECENRRRVREVGCDHHEFTCEEACSQDSSADLQFCLLTTSSLPPDPHGFEYVTCGSSIKLVHDASRFRLHSHEIAYGSGSGQQSVTTHMARNDVNSLWLVKEGEAAHVCDVGQPISCGALIRLEHVPTRRNLHAHRYKAPLTTNHLEVSAFGVAGEGDSMDSWVLECQESHQCSVEGQCEDDGLWKRGKLVTFRHQATNAWLSTSSKARFDPSNCPNCPINGQQEVSATSTRDSHTILWYAGEGIYVTE